MNLAYKRRRATANLRDSCVVEEPTNAVTDGKGGRKPGIPDEEEHPCTFRASNGTVEKGGDRELLRGNYRFRLPHDAIVEETWIVRYGGRRYVVVHAPPLGAEALTRIVGANDAP